jgi:hypothetical protein
MSMFSPLRVAEKLKNLVTGTPTRVRSRCIICCFERLAPPGGTKEGKHCHHNRQSHSLVRPNAVEAGNIRVNFTLD